MDLGRTIPILRTFDEAKAKELCVNFLGFQVNHERRFSQQVALYVQTTPRTCRLPILSVTD